MLIVSLGLVLFSFWLVLSGHYTALTVTAGAFSVVTVLALAKRMGAIDSEGHPITLVPRGILFYYPWLVKEIVVSAWSVSKLILNPKLPISPTLVQVHGDQKTAVGTATYANSITLTPGTVTARVQGHEMLVHAITREVAEDLLKGKMNARVTRFEGGH